MQFSLKCAPSIFACFRVLGGEDGFGAECHRGHRSDGHRQHHGALGAPPLLHHQGHISSLATRVAVDHMWKPQETNLCIPSSSSSLSNYSLEMIFQHSCDFLNK